MNKAKKVEIPGQLEIDCTRGVIYFHAGNEKWIREFGGVTCLRICSLPKPIPTDTGMLDITHMFGTSWGKVKSDLGFLNAVEFGFRCAEKGWNLQKTLQEAQK